MNSSTMNGVRRRTRRPSLDRVRRAALRGLRRRERSAYRHLLTFSHRVECPICGWAGLAFAPSSKPRLRNRLCPSCASTERYRALRLWLGDRPVAAGARLLEIAPVKLVEPLARELGYDYSSLDLQSPRAQVLGDLCHLPFGDGTLDVIVCFHVLEHIPDDIDAMAEMRRVLRPDGVAVVVVPWEPDRSSTFEDYSIVDPAERERVFGQSDHVRVYGADLMDRLLAADFSVREERWTELFSTAQFQRAALAGDDDRFWLCSQR